MGIGFWGMRGGVLHLGGGSLSSPCPRPRNTTPTGLKLCPASIPAPSAPPVAGGEQAFNLTLCPAGISLSMHGEGKIVCETPGGSVPRWAGACCRGIAIRCDIEQTRGWSGFSPRPENRLVGGAPTENQRPGLFRVASGNNTESRARFRGRKVPEWSRPLAPDSRRWRAVGRRALRAMGNIRADSAGLSRADGPAPPWRQIRQG